MRLEVLPGPAGVSPTQFTISYLINETVVLDAGCLGLVPDVAKQRGVQHILLSHSHADHVASLPIFLDNVYQPGPECVDIYALEATWASISSDIFNERCWPDLLRLSQEESPFFRRHDLQPEQPVTIGDLTILPVSLPHPVPTVGFVISEAGKGSVAIISDTGPSERIWQILNDLSAWGLEDLRLVLLDVSFPERLKWLAEKSQHLCPTLAAQEMRKLRRATDWLAIHLKPAFHEQIRQEVAEHCPGMPIVEVGKTYVL